MSKYRGARYIGNDPIHLFDGSLICRGDITELLSEEAALNDNSFEPVYGKAKKQEIELKPNKIKKKRGK